MEPKFQKEIIAGVIHLGELTHQHMNEITG